MTQEHIREPLAYAMKAVSLLLHDSTATHMVQCLVGIMPLQFSVLLETLLKSAVDSCANSGYNWNQKRRKLLRSNVTLFLRKQLLLIPFQYTPSNVIDKHIHSKSLTIFVYFTCMLIYNYRGDCRFKFNFFIYTSDAKRNEQMFRCSQPSSI